MASGYGVFGGQGRCFPHWQGFLSCYAGGGEEGECKLALDDYMECLHRTKELARLQTVQDEYVRRLNAGEIKEDEKLPKMSSVPRLDRT
ncbi:hypothetical protein PYCC9005_002832 [Savitreella phatthalungensis]